MDEKSELVNTVLLDSGILHLTLNRPEQLNALSRDVLAYLAHIFQTSKNDKSVRAVLITGAGKGFCAGADIKQLAPLTESDGLAFAKFGQAVFRSLELLGKPSLAAVHGFAFGGGCELAMAATMRLAADNTVFGQPEVKLGVIPGFGGTQRLTRLIGKGRALEICLSGRRFSAEEALHWGLVNAVCAPDQLLARAQAILNELVQFSPLTLQSILTAIHEGSDLSFDAACEIEATQFAKCCATADKREGVNAFLEKRAAVFIGA